MKPTALTLIVMDNKRICGKESCKNASGIIIDVPSITSMHHHFSHHIVASYLITKLAHLRIEMPNICRLRIFVKYSRVKFVIEYLIFASARMKIRNSFEH